MSENANVVNVGQGYREAHKCCGGGKCKSEQENSLFEEDTELLELDEEYMEEAFFLMYHLHAQQSEVEMMTKTQRQWFIQRYIHQKQVEKQIMDDMKRSPRIDTDFIKEIERTRNG
jgi:hypothetical protein